MKMMTGGDWSIALNPSSRNALSDSRLLLRIGKELRSVYETVVEEPMPDQLASIVARLEQRDETAGD